MEEIFQFSTQLTTIDKSQRPTVELYLTEQWALEFLWYCEVATLIALQFNFQFLFFIYSCPLKTDVSNKSAVTPSAQKQRQI